MSGSLKPEKTRSFLAVLLSDVLKNRIYQVTESLRQLPLDMKWVEKENYHLTLKFFGFLTKSQLEQINLYLHELTPKLACFSLKFGGWGLFPNEKRPRVLWLGIDGDVDYLLQLHSQLENDLARLGFPPEEKRFHPHLTLGRLRSSSNIESLLKKVKESPLAQNIGSFPVAKLHLMESKLGPAGARYFVLSSYPFRRNPPGSAYV